MIYKIITEASDDYFACTGKREKFVSREQFERIIAILDEKTS